MVRAEHGVMAPVLIAPPSRRTKAISRIAAI